MPSLFVPLVLVATMILAIDIVLVMCEHRATRSPGLVAIFGIAAFPVAIVAHNAISVVIGGEEAVSFFIGLVVAPLATTVGTAAVAVALRHEAPGTAWSLAWAACGTAVFVGYIVAAVVSTLVSGEPSSMSPVAPALQTLSAASLVAGSLVAALTIASRWRRVGFARP